MPLDKKMKVINYIYVYSCLFFVLTISGCSSDNKEQMLKQTSQNKVSEKDVKKNIEQEKAVIAAEKAKKEAEEERQRLAKEKAKKEAEEEKQRLAKEKAKKEAEEENKD